MVDLLLPLKVLIVLIKILKNTC